MNARASNLVEAPEALRTPYERLAALNVNDKVEKKNGLTYLSWAWALDQLLRADPQASWAYGEPVRYGDTMMVFCTVKAFGQERTMQLPVMDHRNKAIPNPDAFQVNTAMQRCLVKAIALHGLGLYIYAGEDLPPGEEKTDDKTDDDKPKNTERKMLDKPIPANVEGVDEWNTLDTDTRDMLQGVADSAIALAKSGKDAHGFLAAKEFDHKTYLALWTQLPSDVRAYIKKQAPRPALASQP